MSSKRLEVTTDTHDARFVVLRIDRMLLILVVFVLAFIATVHTFGIVAGIKSDDRIVQETKELNEEIRTANERSDQTFDITRANTEFIRCAFLIEPDVKKTPKVLDVCVEEAKFPEDTGR